MKKLVDLLIYHRMSVVCFFSRELIHNLKHCSQTYLLLHVPEGAQSENLKIGCQWLCNGEGYMIGSTGGDLGQHDVFLLFSFATDITVQNNTYDVTRFHDIPGPQKVNKLMNKLR